MKDRFWYKVLALSLASAMVLTFIQPAYATDLKKLEKLGKQLNHSRVSKRKAAILELKRMINDAGRALTDPRSTNAEMNAAADKLINIPRILSPKARALKNKRLYKEILALRKEAMGKIREGMTEEEQTRKYYARLKVKERYRARKGELSGKVDKGTPREREAAIRVLRMIPDFIGIPIREILDPKSIARHLKKETYSGPLKEWARLVGRLDLPKVKPEDLILLKEALEKKPTKIFKEARKKINKILRPLEKVLARAEKRVRLLTRKTQLEKRRNATLKELEKAAKSGETDAAIKKAQELQAIRTELEEVGEQLDAIGVHEELGLPSGPD